MAELDAKKWQFAIAFLKFVCPKRSSGGPVEFPLPSPIVEYIKQILDKHEMEIYFLFSEETALYSNCCSDDRFNELMLEIQENFSGGTFDADEFIWLCVVVSYYARIAQSRGCWKASQSAAKAIYNILMFFEDSGEFTDDSWDSLLSIARDRVSNSTASDTREI